MKVLTKWIMLLVTIAGALALAFGAYERAALAWDGVVSYRSLYSEEPLPVSEETSAVSSRVVLVIIDGLRLDASRDMSTLEALRDYGSDLTLKTSQPSLSYPNWTTILSGTTQDYHGVVTNWHEGAAPVETLLDTAERAGVSRIVVGPSDIATLYPAAARASASHFREWDDEYLSGEYVDETLRLVEQVDPRFVLLHLPDIDEAGHDFGGASAEYARVVARVDADLRRLVEGLQGSATTFVIVSDHGHIDTGGHGGWEPVVTDVPCIIAGEGVRLSEGLGRQEDVAPTVAVLAGLPVPRAATGHAYAAALGPEATDGIAAAREQRKAAVEAYTGLLRRSLDGSSSASRLQSDATDSEIGAALVSVRRDRLAQDRKDRRFGFGFELAVASLLTIVFVGVVSWRALVAALSGSAAYYAVYNALFFLVHGNRWSLSAFNSEDLMDAWMNTRLAEAAGAGIVAVVVAALVYPLLRNAPKGPRGPYMAGWLTLGPLTVVVTQLTVALQVAWFEWAWGSTPKWGLPDLLWGFKFDLDLVQVTALGAAVVISPVVSYLVGRYHPRTGNSSAEEAH